MKGRIDAAVRGFMIGLYPFIKYYYKSAFPKNTGKCFHVIGLDILLDKNGSPWIL